jgi:undecaprenyl-diphosphatase
MPPFLTILQAIFLGLIQGATEFIPVSSSAHLIIVPWIFGWQNVSLTSLPFDVALHLGTLLAVLIFFAKDWVRLAKAGWQSIVERKIGEDPDRRLAWFLVIGTIPGGIAGFLLESKIEKLFHQPGEAPASGAMVAMAIIITLLGAGLFLAEHLARHKTGLENLTLKGVLAIGFAQAMAIFPGISRSGSTMTAGLALGLKREAAARFSFLLSAPIIAGAGLKSLVDIFSEFKSGGIDQSGLYLFPVGMLAAAISGYLCIRFLLGYLQKNSVDIFIYYRWALAILIVVIVLARG